MIRVRLARLLCNVWHPRTRPRARRTLPTFPNSLRGRRGKCSHASVSVRYALPRHLLRVRGKWPMLKRSGRGRTRRRRSPRLRARRHPTRRGKGAPGRRAGPTVVEAAEIIVEEAAKRPAPAPGLRATRRPGAALTPQYALALLSAARQAQQAPRHGAAGPVRRARRGGASAVATGRGDPPVDEAPNAARNIRVRRREFARGARKICHPRATVARHTSPACRRVAAVGNRAGTHAPHPDGRAVERVPRVEALGVSVCLSD